MKAMRQEAILELVRARGAVSTSELETEVGASAATLRRDLSRLEGEGKLRRTFGGATAFETRDDPFVAVLGVNGEAKRAIARAAASQITDGQTIILDVGTTVHYLAAELVHRPITVVTGSLAVFEVLAASPETKLILLGGEFVPEYRCVTGFLAEDSLRNVHADQAFLGCSGVSDTGDIRDTTASQIPLKRAILRVSERSTLLVDSAKFPGVGSATAASIAMLDQIITDAALPDRLAAVCEAGGTAVVMTAA